MEQNGTGKKTTGGAGALGAGRTRCNLTERDRKGTFWDGLGWGATGSLGMTISGRDKKEKVINSMDLLGYIVLGSFIGYEIKYNFSHCINMALTKEISCYKTGNTNKNLKT